MKIKKFNYILLLGLAGFAIGIVFPGCRADGEALRWKKQEGRMSLFSGPSMIGYLEPLVIPGLRVEDQVDDLGGGTFKITRVFRNTLQVAAEPLRLTFDFVHAAKASWLMIPAVSYDGNTWGRGQEPKGFRQADTWWSFSSSRVSIPGATYSEGDRWAVALWGELDKAGTPFSCSLMPEEGKTTHRLILPEEEKPTTYVNRDKYEDGFQGNLSLAAGESIAMRAVLVVTKLQPEHAAMEVFLRKAWKMIPHPEVKIPDSEQIWNLATRFLKQSLWVEEKEFAGFSIGLWLRNGGWIQRPVWKYEIGWAGQNASISLSLLVDYLKNGNVDSRDKALLCLDTWARYAPLPNGLFRNHFDYILGLEKGEEVLDACNLGDAAADYFQAYDLAKKCGIEREFYKKLALGICDFLLADQQSSGQYGKGWRPDGTCLYRDGTVGAFIVPALIRAFRATGEAKYLDSAKRGYDFYYRDFVANGFTSAGALDTWCIDKESSWPMLRSALMLFDQTGDRAYLKKAEKTSWYISTWMWHYSQPFAPDTDFVRYGYDTFGGTAVSTQHHHLDPFGVAMVPDWIRLSKLTGDPIWEEKALAAWANGCQVIADGVSEIHGVVRPAGSQTEAYFQTRWGGKPGFFHDWLVAWPSAFRLETLRLLEEPLKAAARAK